MGRVPFFYSSPLLRRLFQEVIFIYYSTLFVCQNYDPISAETIMFSCS